MRVIRYIKTAVFILTALSVVDLMTQAGLTSAGRFQYGDFAYPFLLRTLADIALLTSLILLAVQQLTMKNRGPVYWTASLVYLLFISPDLIVWLWLTTMNPIYWYILIVHSLPILLILHSLVTERNINFKFLLIGGLLFLVSAFIYDIVFINIPYQDAPQELFDKRLRNQKILYFLYYLGFLIIIVGLTQIVTRKNKTA